MNQKLLYLNKIQASFNIFLSEIIMTKILYMIIYQELVELIIMTIKILIVIKNKFR